MTDSQAENTLVIIKPDSFWRKLDSQVESRVKALGLKVVTELALTGDKNLPQEKWREFYQAAIGDRPAILEGTSKYMAFGPVKMIHLTGEGAVQKRSGRPWAPPDPGRRIPAQSAATSGSGPMNQTPPTG